MNLVSAVLSQYRLLQDDNTLEAEGLDVHSVHKVYVSSIFDRDISESSKNTKNELPNSKLLSVIESLERVVWLNVQLPEVNNGNSYKVSNKFLTYSVTNSSVLSYRDYREFKHSVLEK